MNSGEAGLGVNSHNFHNVTTAEGWWLLLKCVCDIFNCCTVLLQSESKREEFRRYLEGAGVLDAFTKGDTFILSQCSLMPRPHSLRGKKGVW